MRAKVMLKKKINHYSLEFALDVRHPKWVSAREKKNQFISQISLPFVNRCCVNILLRFILYQVPFNAQVAVFYFLLPTKSPPDIFFKCLHWNRERERNDYGKHCDGRKKSEGNEMWYTTNKSREHKKWIINTILTWSILFSLKNTLFACERERVEWENYLLSSLLKYYVESKIHKFEFFTDQLHSLHSARTTCSSRNIVKKIKNRDESVTRHFCPLLRMQRRGC